MEITYLCPECRAVLNVAGNVVLSVKNQNGDFGLLLLHSSLGNYEVLHHPEFTLIDGEESHFRCPACHTSLEYGAGPKLAKVIMRDENQNEFRIVFSRMKGEHSTYKIQGESIEVFGRDSKKHIDFVTLSKMH